MRYKISVFMEPKDLFYNNISNFINQHEFYLTTLLNEYIYYKEEEMKTNFNVDYILKDFIENSIREIKSCIMKVGLVYKFRFDFNSNAKDLMRINLSFAKKKDAVFSVEKVKKFVTSTFNGKDNFFRYEIHVTDRMLPFHTWYYGM